jgi:hypothetical protein
VLKKNLIILIFSNSQSNQIVSSKIKNKNQIKSFIDKNKRSTQEMIDRHAIISGMQNY